MKKFILGLIVVILLIAGLKLFVFEHRNNCRKEGGLWYENMCLNSETPEDDLKKFGLIREENTDKTDIKVTYPYNVLEYNTIYQFLQTKVKSIKKDNGFEDEDIELGMSGHPWSLSIDMNNFAEGGNLASILGYVFSFTGGAHPNHSFFSTNFDTESQDLIKFSDLFENDKIALDAISKYSVSNIIEQKSERLNEKITEDEWLIEGAGPDLKNYSIFVFVPAEDKKIDGIKFVFPPYQVGPYAEGTYEVIVSSELFYDFLDGKYKNSFVVHETK